MNGLRAELEEMVTKADQRIEARREAGRPQIAQRVDISFIRGLLAAYPAEPTPEQVGADLAQDEQAHARYYAQPGVPVEEGYAAVFGILGSDQRSEHPTTLQVNGLVWHAIHAFREALNIPGTSQSLSAALLPKEPTS